MNIRSFALVVVSSCALSLAAEVGKSSDGEDRYVISVPTGETYKLTSDDIAAAAGRTLVKQGDGTLQGGGSVASFPGEIRIEAGTYHILSASGFGTKAGATVVCDGATLLLPAASVKIEVPAQEQLVASGSGFEDAGAIRVTGSMGASLGRLALGADALLAFESDTTFPSAEIALEGHVLTLKGAAESVAATFSGVSAVSGGTIDVQTGRLKFEGRSTLLGTGDVYIRSGAKLAMKESSVETGWTLHLDDGAQIYPSDGYVTSELDNRWGGPVVSAGEATIAYTWNNTKPNLATTFAAPLSGSGQISVLYGACLQLLASGGEYSGLISVQGKDGAGGLVLGQNGALPVSSQGIKIASGAGLILKGTDSFDLPQITAGSGDSYAKSDAPWRTGTVAALQKNGSGALTLSAPLHVTNTARVAAGVLRVPVPEVSQPGLFSSATNFASETEWHDFFKAIDPNEKDFSSFADGLLALGRGLGLSTADAYRSWGMPATTEKYRAVAYEGVMWMPETTNAVYTFAVSFADVAAIWIDGSLVVFREGSKSYSGGTYFHEFASVELSPGPHAFRALLSHKKTGSWGPKSIDAPDALGVVWEDNMGLAWRVGTPDPSAPTNSATFLKFVDSGDGSLLSTAALPTLAALVEDPPRFRASFDALSFSAGTTLDLAAPNLPQVVLTVPLLEGFPVISNGSFRVSGTWLADLESQPDGVLVLGESAELSFGASALLDLACSGSVSDLKGRVIARGPVGAILNGPAEVRVNGKSGRWRTVVETVGGTSCLTLEREPSGMLLLFR